MAITTVTPSERPSKTRSGTFYGAVGPYIRDTLNNGSATDHYTIFFPAMPEEIDLSRAATYKITSTPVHPDGIHWYVATEPLSVPVSFDLHAHDIDYCTQGPLTILRTCAILHSLLLPIRTSKSQQNALTQNIDSQITAAASVNQSDSTRSKTDDASTSKSAADNSSSEKNTSTSTSGEDITAYLNRTKTEFSDASTGNTTGVENTSFAYPPPCWLRLINGNPYSIQLSGYIKDVHVKIKGPWLTASQGGMTYYNLPTSAHFEFTFVNCPCYTNDFSDMAFTSAFLQDVGSYLYDSQNIREKLVGTGVAIPDITIVGS
jgi:hypothetical protein